MFYVPIFFVSIIFSFIADKTSNKVSDFFLVLTILTLAIVGGCRDVGVGTDTVTYSMSYYWMAHEVNSIRDFLDLNCSKGYLLLNLIAINIVDNVWSCHFIVQLFTIGTIYWAVRIFRKQYCFRYVIFTIVYCCIFYNQSFNFMKQYCAMALMLLAFVEFLQKNYIQCVVCFALGIIFHFSTVLFIIVPMLYYSCVIGYENKWHYWAVLISIIVLVSIHFYYNQFLLLFNDQDSLIGVYAERYGEYSIYDGRTSVRKSLLFIVLYFWFIVFRAYKENGYFKGEVFFIGTLLLMFMSFYSLSFRSAYLYRLSLYFYLPLMLYVIPYIFGKNRNLLVKALFLILVVLDWYVYIYMHNGANTIPYRSSIFGLI